MSEKTKKIFNIFIHSITKPPHLAILFRDIKKNIAHSVQSDDTHLQETINWLSRSQDVTGGKGCAGIYSFEKGWHPPYPETTGYIISTFLDYAKLTNKEEYVNRARTLGDWETDIQFSSGAIRGGVGINSYPIVFNTGQVILGWTSLYEFTKDEKYLHATTKASDWLLEIQDDDGKWSRHTYNNIPHAYNIRVAWSLLKTFAITDNPKLLKAAEKNIRWVLAQSNKNGWIHHMGFTTDKNPLTHTIAYTLRGLLECSFYVETNLRNDILNLVINASNAILSTYSDVKLNRKTHFLPGTFDSNWNPTSNYSCLTGNAQMAIIWMMLYRLTGKIIYRNTAFEMIDQLKATQNLTTNNKGIRGGIAGSFPIWGGYVPFAYPNWAAKFFADSIILKTKTLLSLNDNH